MLSSKSLSVLATLFAVSIAYTIDPPTTVPTPSPITDCTNWAVIVSGDTCATLAAANGITVAQFNNYNPSVGSTCVLIIGDSYCVEQNFGIPPVSTTSSSKVSTTTGNGVTTPGPIQTGLVSNCNKFYLVASGDECASIATANGISLANLYLWNPAVGSTCATLIAGDYICIGVIGSSSTTLTKSTKSTNGITTPTPIQTGMVSNCNSFYLVVSGDECAAIALKEGISLTSFYAWNPAVGSSCSTLVLGDYVCVNVVGGSTSTTKSTSSKSTNGISTPTPVQTGMVTNCNTFYLVVSGDECGTIASSHGISLANFYLWNPAVGSSCGSLGLGDYVCVNVIGGTTLTSTSTKKTTTTNGIITPTPIQTGMVSNCNTFYLVKSGDQCGTIASSHGISLASFYAWNPAVGSSCATLGLGDYVCVNVIGGTTTTSKATTTSAGNGVATPTPVQTGITTKCKTFHLVVSGDQCGLIATAAGITLANFYLWNPAVGSSCATLGLGYYVCIAIL